VSFQGYAQVTSRVDARNFRRDFDSEGGNGIRKAPWETVLAIC
jgi:hypothetical protein